MPPLRNSDKFHLLPFYESGSRWVIEVTVSPKFVAASSRLCFDQRKPLTFRHFFHIHWNTTLFLFVVNNSVSTRINKTNYCRNVRPRFKLCLSEIRPGSARFHSILSMCTIYEYKARNRLLCSVFFEASSFQYSSYYETGIPTR